MQWLAYLREQTIVEIAAAVWLVTLKSVIGDPKNCLDPTNTPEIDEFYTALRIHRMNATEAQSLPTAESSKRSDGGILLSLWRWFWRVMLIVSLVVVWYCFYVPSNNVAWAASYAAAQQQAAESGKPMILFFTGQWCVPCKIMKRNVWADDQVTASVNAAYIPVMVDVGDPEAAAAISRYHVGATPETIVTDSQGNVLQQKQGGMSKADFLEMLGKAKG